jgi:hypothetical protein
VSECWTPAWEEACRVGLAAHARRASAGEPDPAVPVDCPMLDRIVAAFGLSGFERDLLVLAAADELGDPVGALSPATALERLDGAHWAAVAPSAALRRWELVRVDGTEPLHGRVRIDERVLFALLGVRTVDGGLRRLARPLEPTAAADALPSIANAAAMMAERLAGEDSPLLQLSGPDLGASRRVAASAAARLGLAAWELDVSALPAAPEDIDALSVLLERELVLGDAIAVAVDEASDAPGRRALRRLADRTGAPLVVVAERLGRDWERPTVAIELAQVAPDELTQLWTDGLGPAARDVTATIARLVSDFGLPVDRVSDVAADARAEAARGEDLGAATWRAARRCARSALDGLAERVTAVAAWEDLVLPELHLRTLREIAAHVRARGTVEREWGFGARGESLAVTALFHGPSGVGKTLAARVIASELDLDLYRIDLSQTVSKYIGETEKNLKRLFDAAEQSGAVLVFDEADALFGKRSEVHDAQDRYANIEVSYLLQRMDAYRGLAVLTTNLPANLDAAFQRRIRYAVAFPLPDQASRRRIWARAFPAAAPASELDLDQLAQLAISGAGIAAIALGAAVQAADAGVPIAMAHVLRAAQSEYAKLGRSISATELEGWSLPEPDRARLRAVGAS